jgi:beta-lactamase regulating signal transducer with metallopeptidase domain
MTQAVISWLLTYLLHSTILVGGALIIVRRLGDHRLALQESVLRAALVGGLVTASLQVGLSLAPLAGTLTLPDGAAAAIRTVADSAPRASAAVPATDLTPPPASGSGSGWAAALLLFWGAGALASAIGLGRATLQLRSLLATCTARPPWPLLERIAHAMGLRRAIGCSTSPAISVPFVTGITRPEICCPERFDELAIEYQRGLFAHELAHVARRDPAWQLLYRIGEAALFLQPLNRIARRRLEEIAEHLSDERAAACTGDRLGLARCLVAVAHWPVMRPVGVPAVAFASSPRLDRRVRRLLDGPDAADRRPRWLAALALLLMTLAVGLLPVVATSPAHAELSQTGSAAAPVDRWSKAESALQEEAEGPPSPPAPALDPAPAPEAAHEAPAAPEPEVAAAAQPAPGAAPKPPAGAPPAAQAAPVDGSALRSPVAPAAPAPPGDPSAPDDLQRMPDAPRAGAPEKLESRPHTIEELRARAEARDAADRAREAARAAAEEARHIAERDRAAAREAAHNAQRLSEEQRREMRDRAEALARERRELDREGADRAREAARAAAEEARHIDREAAAGDRERARAKAEAARELAREMAVRGARLNDEEREALRQKARALRSEAERRNRETADRAREQARRLAAEAERPADGEKD